MIRDKKSRALLNNDGAELNKYLCERERVRKVNQLAEEVKDIKDNLSHIRTLLEKMEKS